MNKLVAFADTLGFKQKITSLNHRDARLFIEKFNSEIYSLWKRLEFEKDSSIQGQTFSDSLIIYTENDDASCLEKILIFLSEFNKISITKCGLPLRSGIAKGEFDKLPSTEFTNLQTKLVVGVAFIDAYLLESSGKIKGSKIIYNSEIHSIVLQELTKFHSKELLKLEDGQILYEMPWGDIAYLTANENEALFSFIELAVKSKWLDHYFHTLDTFLTKEPKEEKHLIFAKIIERLKRNYKYTDLDVFIENFLKTDGLSNIKRSFLAFLREKL